MSKLSPRQKTVIRCAYADLVGAMQAQELGDPHAHDWDAHQLSIDEMEAEFPLVKTPEMKAKIKKLSDPMEDALLMCRAQLGDRVRDGSACDEEVEAYEAANEALGDKGATQS